MTREQLATTLRELAGYLLRTSDLYPRGSANGKQNEREIEACQAGADALTADPPACPVCASNTGDVPPLPTAAPAPEKAPLPCPECREVDRVWAVGDGRYRCAACDVGYTAHDSKAALAPAPETVRVSREDELREALAGMLAALSSPEDAEGLCAAHGEEPDLCDACLFDQQKRMVVAADAARAALSPSETAPKGGQ